VVAFEILFVGLLLLNPLGPVHTKLAPAKIASKIKVLPVQIGELVLKEGFGEAITFIVTESFALQVPVDAVKTYFPDSEVCIEAILMFCKDEVPPFGKIQE
jgi:hypothetical protein